MCFAFTVWTGSFFAMSPESPRQVSQSVGTPETSTHVVKAMSAGDPFGLRKAKRVTITKVLIQVDSKKQQETMYLVTLCILRDIKRELLFARNWYLNDCQPSNDIEINPLVVDLV